MNSIIKAHDTGFVYAPAHLMLTDEFNEWHDVKHLSQRRAIRTALRFVCTEGWPRFLALYDLDSPGVLSFGPEPPSIRNLCQRL